MFHRSAFVVGHRALGRSQSSAAAAATAASKSKLTAPLVSPARSSAAAVASVGKARPPAPGRKEAPPLSVLPGVAASGGGGQAGSNFTLPSPTLKGPLPSTLKNVWKRRPGKRTALLHERTLSEMFGNLRHLASVAKVHGPPRPEAVHRMLRRVTDATELDVAVKGLHVLQSAGTAFSHRTAHELVEAGFRSGAPAVAIDILKRGRDTGVVPVSGTYVSLLRLAVRTQQPAVVSDVVWMQWASGDKPDREMVGRIVWAWAALGRLDKAVAMYGHMRAEGWKDDARPLHNILSAVVAAASASSSAPATSGGDGTTSTPAAAAASTPSSAAAAASPPSSAAAAAPSVSRDVAVILKKAVLPDAAALPERDAVKLRELVAKVDAIIAGVLPSPSVVEPQPAAVPVEAAPAVVVDAAASASAPAAMAKE